MDLIKKQNAFQINYTKTTKEPSTTVDNFSAMRQWQQEAFSTLKDAPYMILNAPMGSGKSWMICLLSAYKMKQDMPLRCIIGVPQTIIASGFSEANILMPDEEKLQWHSAHNLCNDLSPKKTTHYIIEWLLKPSSSFDDRILLCTHASLVNVYKKLREIGRLDLLNNLLLWVDEAHHLKNNTLAYAKENTTSNAIGELIARLLTKADENIHIGLSTASFFRGDRYTLLTEKMEEKFERFNLPYDEYLKSMRYLESFSFDFLVCGHDYPKAIALLINERRGKDIIFIPHPTSRHSMGDKYEEVKSIIGEYQKIHGGKIVKTVDGLTILRGKDKDFRILDLVDENRRAEKKEFLSGRFLKEDPDALDVIITLGMFKEGADWIWADRAIIVGTRDSLVDIVQMPGRLFRDAPGKSHVETVQLLPFSLDQQDENFTENLNNYLTVIYASLILEDIFKPVSIRLPKDNQQKNEHDISNKQTPTQLTDLIPDTSTRSSIFENAIKLLIESSNDSETEGEKISALHHKFQGEMPRILQMHGINSHMNEISDLIWRALTRRAWSVQGISVEDIDFNIVHQTHPLGWMLRYTSGICGINTFQELRTVIQSRRGVWRTLEDAKNFVLQLGLKSETEWQLYISNQMPHLPSLPNDIPKAPWAAYEKDGWISMGNFLGTNQIAPFLRKYRPYEKAREFACSLALKKKDDWPLYTKGKIMGLPPLPTDIPAGPDKTYQRKEYGEKWNGWGDFLGTGRIQNQDKAKLYRTLKEAMKFVHPLGLNTAKEWRRYVLGNLPRLPTLPNDIPKNPNESYSEWVNWPMFLGSKISKFNCRRSFWSIEQSKELVHKLGLTTQKDWQQYCAGELLDLPAKPLEIPSNPGKKYKSAGWKGYKDWLKAEN